MKNYKVTITETLEKEIIVKAKSFEDALSKVKERYRNERYVLDESDLTNTRYSVDLLQRERDYEH